MSLSGWVTGWVLFYVKKARKNITWTQALEVYAVCQVL